MTDTKAELLGCPFCGAAPFGIGYDGQPAEENSFHWRCRCGAQGPRAYGPDVTAAWNRRISIGQSGEAPAPKPASYFSHDDFAEGFDDGIAMALRQVTKGRTSMYRADDELRVRYATRKDADGAMDILQNMTLADAPAATPEPVGEAPAPSLESAKGHAVLQAQSWAQEARAQRATVLEILRYFGLPEHDWEALRLIKEKLGDADSAHKAMTSPVVPSAASKE